MKKNVRKVKLKNGRFQYRDENGRISSTKDYIKSNLRELSGEELTGNEAKEFSRQIKLSQRVRNLKGQWISKTAQDFLQERADERGISLQDLIRNNPEAVEIASNASIDLEFFSRVIFDKITKHSGKIKVDGVLSTKSSAKEVFFNQINKDFDTITAMIGKPPIEIVYGARLYQKDGTLDISTKFIRYISS